MTLRSPDIKKGEPFKCTAPADTTLHNAIINWVTQYKASPRAKIVARVTSGNPLNLNSSIKSNGITPDDIVFVKYRPRRGRKQGKPKSPA